MNSILRNEAVVRVQKVLSEFNNSLKIIILENTARTAKDAANALNCEIGAIVKSLLLKADDEFVLCSTRYTSLNCGGKVRRYFNHIHIDCFENIAAIPQLLMAFHLLSLGVLQALHHRPGPSFRQRHRLKMLCGPLV